jgi:hypothetical protein
VEPTAEAPVEPAVESPAEEAAEEEEEEDRSLHFGHRFQGGIGILAGTGYFFEIAYGGDTCYQEGSDNENVCHGRAPVFLDIQLSFGVTEGLEILAEYRLGLLTETFTAKDGASTTESRPMAVGLGLRYYVAPLNRAKFFLGALFDIDFTSGLKTDFTVRPIFGFQFDFVRWVGLFVQASVKLSFVRAFGLALDGAAGLQIRFP